MVGRRVRLGGIEQAAQVAIAKAGGGKFAARDDKQGQVVRVADAQGTYPVAMIAKRARDAVEEQVEGDVVVDRGQSVKVIMVGLLGDLSTAVEVRDAGAQRTPGPPLIGIGLARDARL
jgi:hypothetical protein